MLNEQISERMHELGKRIGLETNSNLYPMVAKSNNIFSDGASIYEDNGNYHYVCMERGNENKHFVEPNIKEILYYVFNDITFLLAIKYELEHRKGKEDSRKILFKKQLELLGMIDKKYQGMREKIIAEVLEKAPYQDL